MDLRSFWYLSLEWICGNWCRDQHSLYGITKTIFHHRGMLHTVSRADFIRATIQNLENYMRIGYEQSKTHGPSARQFVILFDMEGFNLKQYTWRPGTRLPFFLFYCFLWTPISFIVSAGEVVISLIKMYEANYPEILKCCYIINGNEFAFN